MSTLRKFSFREYFPWLLTCVVAFFMILANQNVYARAIRASLGDFFLPALTGIHTIIRIPSIFQENRILSERVIELQQEVMTKLEAEQEVERLRAQLGYKQQTGWSMVAAKAIGLSSGSGIRGMVINCGSLDGIRENQPVISTAGAVGRIERTGLFNSVVILLSDPKLGVAGRLLRTRESGIIRSGDNDKFHLEGIPTTAHVSAGDTVVTSGLDLIFPPGVMIGVVTEVNYDKDAWLLDILVEPAVSSASAEELFVITQHIEIEEFSVPVRH